MKEIKWAVLGCGVIANEMAVALQKNGKNIYAVGNRTHEKAAAFAEKYGIGKVYDDFHEMFTDPEVDVIYITTPHNTHLGFNLLELGFCIQKNLPFFAFLWSVLEQDRRFELPQIGRAHV